MHKNTLEAGSEPAKSHAQLPSQVATPTDSRDVLSQILRDGAQRRLQAAIQKEVENWCHIRTTHRIGSTFATIRLRHRKKWNNGSAMASLVMLVKLGQSACRGWRKLRGHQHIPDLIKSVNFIDGVNEQTLKKQSSSDSQRDTTHTEIVA